MDNVMNTQVLFWYCLDWKIIKTKRYFLKNLELQVFFGKIYQKKNNLNGSKFKYLNSLLNHNVFLIHYNSIQYNSFLLILFFFFAPMNPCQRAHVASGHRGFCLSPMRLSNPTAVQQRKMQKQAVQRTN